MKIVKLTPLNKGTLINSFDLEMPKWGVTIYGMTEHRKGDQRWIGFPARSYESPTEPGKKKYWPYVKFNDEKHREAFQQAVLKLIDAMVPAVAVPPQQEDEGELPF